MFINKHFGGWPSVLGSLPRLLLLLLAEIKSDCICAKDAAFDLGLNLCSFMWRPTSRPLAISVYRVKYGLDLNIRQLEHANENFLVFSVWIGRRNPLLVFNRVFRDQECVRHWARDRYYRAYSLKALSVVSMK